MPTDHPHIKPVHVLDDDKRRFMEKPPALRDRARALFFETDGKGHRLWSYAQIADKITREFRETVNPVTIRTWAKKYAWRELFEKGVKRGIALGEGATAEDVDQIEEILADKTAEEFRQARDINVEAGKVLLARLQDEDKVKAIPTKDIIQAFKGSAEVMLLLQKNAGLDKGEGRDMDAFAGWSDEEIEMFAETGQVPRGKKLTLVK